MADHYYNTIGEAWLGMMEFSITHFLGGTTLQAGWVITWSAASVGVPATFIAISATPASFNRYIIKESLTSPGIPIRSILMEPGFNTILVCASDVTDPTYVNFEHLLTYAMDAMRQLVASMTGYTATWEGSHDKIWPGMGGAGYLMYTYRYESDTDICRQMISCFNNAWKPDAFDFQQPFAPSYGPQVVVNNSVTLSSGPAAPPMDLDISINQGQAILSVLSKTTTMLP